ncbi:hypothetical protein niasHT_009284 [Heterodera trifolii]|uniref:Protein kinase domain-containing protein n=1 Tax=Heterodera trifolii TaxID=157864 RepID=A0ABD2MBS6_9BILA
MFPNSKALLSVESNLADSFSKFHNTFSATIPSPRKPSPTFCCFIATHLTYKLLNQFKFDYLDALITLSNRPKAKRTPRRFGNGPTERTPKEAPKAPSAVVRCRNVRSFIHSFLGKELREEDNGRALQRAVDSVEETIDEFLPALMAQAKLLWDKPNGPKLSSSSDTRPNFVKTELGKHAVHAGEVQRSEQMAGESERDTGRHHHHGHHRHRPSARKVLRHFGYQSAHKLGSGHYSKVYKVFDAQQTRHFAVKVTDLNNVSEVFRTKFVPRELSIWRQLDHPNTVRMHHDFQESDYLFEVLDYAKKGDLHTYLERHGPLDETTCRAWMRQVIDGVSYLHRNRIAHRDLKPENILLFEGGVLKITDYGFAKQCAVGDMSSTFCGTRNYKAPELLRKRRYDPFKPDVWSLGVVCFVMLTNTMPFSSDVSRRQMVKEQRNSQYKFPDHLVVSSQCRGAIDTILTFDPEQRPSIFDVSSLPWFSEDVSDRSGSSSDGNANQ